MAHFQKVQGILGRIGAWLAPPHVRETAALLKKEQRKEVLQPPKPSAPPPVRKVEETTQQVSQNALQNLRIVGPDVQEVPLRDRALTYARQKARERQVDRFFYSMKEDGVQVVFSETPWDAYLIMEAVPGGHCHPVLGVFPKLVAGPQTLDGDFTEVSL